MRRYIIGLLVAIAVIIFIIIRLLSGGGEPQPEQKQLEDYANGGTTMRMVIKNAIQAPQNHREVEVVVGRDESRLTLYRGYQGDVVRSKGYAMSEAAYRDFLRGLRISGNYTQGNSDESLRDESGYCALGQRVTYEIVGDSGDVIQHFWSTDCGQRTFQGNVDVVQELFQKQIPDYDTLTQDVDF